MVLFGLVAAAVFPLIAWLLFSFLPRRWVRGIPKFADLNGQEQFELENQTRKTIAEIAGAVVVIAGIFGTAYSLRQDWIKFNESQKQDAKRFEESKQEFDKQLKDAQGRFLTEQSATEHRFEKQMQAENERLLSAQSIANKNLEVANASLDASRSAKLADEVNKAFEHLDSSNDTIRVAAIYRLGAFVDRDEYQKLIIEALSAFIRVKAPYPTHDPTVPETKLDLAAELSRRAARGYPGGSPRANGEAVV